MEVMVVEVDVEVVLEMEVLEVRVSEGVLLVDSAVSGLQQCWRVAACHHMSGSDWWKQ